MSNQGLTDLDLELAARWKLGIKPGLARMQQVLSRLEFTPEHLGRRIIVAGTNGKGSTSTYLDSIARQAGARWGLYTSPHLVTARERIRVVGEMVEPARIAEVRQRVEDAEHDLGLMLTAFEWITVIGALVFAGAGLDGTVLEVGLGGRLDATNVLEPQLAVITPVAFDHQAILGSTLREIAGHKAGVMRGGCPAVIAAQEPEAQEVLLAEAEALGVSRVYLEGRDYHWTLEEDGVVIQLPSGRILGPVRPGMAGSFQARNAATAAMAAWCAMETGLLPMDPDAILRGLGRGVLGGRFQRAMVDGIPVVMDVAHNPHGIQALVSAFAREGGRARVTVFGAKHDKEAPEMLRLLAQVTQTLALVTIPGTDSWSTRELAESCPAGCSPIILEGPEQIAGLLSSADAELGPALICGSHYLVGWVLKHLVSDALPAVVAPGIQALG